MLEESGVDLMGIATNQVVDHRQPPAILSVEKPSMLLSAPLNPVDDRELPSHLRRTLGPLRPAANDRLGQRINFLLRLHPELEQTCSNIDLRRSTVSQRRAILQEIESQLASFANA